MFAEEEYKVDSDYANNDRISLTIEVGGDNEHFMKLNSARKKMPQNLANLNKNLDDTSCKN